MMQQRRRVPRYFADVMALVTYPESDMSTPVQVEVLSVQGCCVRGSGIPEAGAKCRLTMRWKAGEIRAEARVTWKDAQGLAGLKFHDLDQESSNALRELCATLRMQPLVPWSALDNP